MATKAGSVIDAWAEVAQNAIRIGDDTTSVAADVAMNLLIDVALVTTTAHTGTKVIVQVSEETSGDGTWSTLEEFISKTGTAVVDTLNATEPIGETTLAMDNPASSGLDNDGKFKFIEHTTPANSEIVYQVSNTGDASDTITIAFGLTNQQDTNSQVFDFDDATAEAVLQKVVPLPPSVSRVRVIYNNKFDPDGSAVFTRARLANMSDAAA